MARKSLKEYLGKMNYNQDKTARLSIPSLMITSNPKCKIQSKNNSMMQVNLANHLQRVTSLNLDVSNLISSELCMLIGSNTQTSLLLVREILINSYIIGNCIKLLDGIKLASSSRQQGTSKLIRKMILSGVLQ